MNNRHSEQGQIMRFYTTEQHNEVIGALRLLLGKKFDELIFDGQNLVIHGERYQKRSYYIAEDCECIFNDAGDCIDHKCIKNILAQGVIPLEQR